MGVSWIKITTSIFDDEKIKIIDSMPDHDAILVIWIKLLTLAGRCNAKGCLIISDSMPYTDEMLAAVFSRPLNTVKMALDLFVRLGMIYRSGSIQLVNWEKHQNEAALEIIRENERERKRIQRSKQTLQITENHNVPDNVPDKSRNVRILDIDIDKELDKDIKTKKQNEQFDTFWNQYPKKVSKTQAERTFNALMKKGIDLEVILHCLKNYKDEIQTTGKEMQFIKNPSTFLNNYLDYANKTTIVYQDKPKDRKCPKCNGTINNFGFCKDCKYELPI